jgi:uncharacterized MAPEG superfamily protein
MSVPVAVLLAFAVWTLLTLFCSVGVYRWSRILSGRAQLRDFPAEAPEGPDWYKRAMRAHANCVENLPVYGAIVVAIAATGASGPTLDALAITLIVARVCQTLVHVAFEQTNRVIAARFAFFFTQAACMLATAGILVARA